MTNPARWELGVTDVVRAAHEVMAWVVIGANAAAGLWALGALRWSGLRRRELWWFTAVAQTLIGVQVLLGVVMVGGQGRQVEQFHMFYGFVAIITAAIMYSYRQSLAHRIYWLYGLGGLFLMGLGLRAIVEL